MIKNNFFVCINANNKDDEYVRGIIFETSYGNKFECIANPTALNVEEYNVSFTTQNVSDSTTARPIVFLTGIYN